MLALHSAFIYHNDIKLANVYVKNQKAALGDYGESVKLEERNLGYEATDCSWMLQLVRGYVRAVLPDLAEDIERLLGQSKGKKTKPKQHQDDSVVKVVGFLT